MSTPFADAARTYLERGWSVFPLPAGKKSPPPSGLTGYNAHRATDRDVEQWSETSPDANLGVWAAPGILGIDVDAYAKKGTVKTGDATLAELEAQLGALPDTWISSARALPSGIRWFAVPADVVFITKLVGIEFIQPTHRYGVVPPSTNPDADGALYRWWVHGRATKRIPRMSDLATLPPAWVEHLTRTGSSRTTGVRAENADETTARAWLTKLGAGEPCRAVRGVLRAHVATMDDGTSRYDNAVEGQMALLHLAVEGHPGVAWAMPQLKAAYLEATAGEGRDTEAEWRRALVAGIAKQIDVLDGAKVKAHAPGKCPDVKVDPFTDASLWPAPTAPREVADRYVRENWMVLES